jgi:hypothetical protein
MRGRSPREEGTVLSVRMAAITAAALFLAIAAFQVALAAGVPWGSAAYGGRSADPDGSLPSNLRAMSALAALILALFAWVVLVRGGAVTGGRLNQRLVSGSTWAIVGLMTANMLGNAASSSNVERWLIGSVTAALVVLCAAVALRGSARR